MRTVLSSILDHHTVPIKDYSQICRILVLCVINTQKLGLNFAISIEVDRLIYSTLHKFLASPPRHIAEPEVQADLDLPQRAPVSTFVGNPFHERGSKIQTQKSNSTATESVSVDHQDGTSLKPVQVETRSVEKSVVKPKPTDTMLDKSVPVPPKNLSKDVPKEHHPQKHQTEASPEITDEADESEQVAEADEPSPSDDQDGDFVAMSTSRFDPVVQDRMAVDDTTTAQSQSSLPAFRDKGKSTASAKEVKEVMDDDNEEVSFMDMEFAINVDDGPDSEYDSDE
ncbi:hypothetical protein HK102_010654 [Quaeritorhiza haematococci]|nr:hypothetical protein HK102_010654 [Quaeritorhiza haematococci]